MQQTKTYNLKLIETSDTFSPDALNKNAETLEAQLARVDAALATKAAQTDLAALTQTVAAKAPQTEITRIDAALATRARIVWGSYVGSGDYGKDKPKEMDFAGTLGCAPKLLIILSQKDHYSLYVVNGAELQPILTDLASSYNLVCNFTWTETGVRWYNTQSATFQMNSNNNTYYYVAFA